MPLDTALPYGLRDVKVTPISTSGALGTPVDLPNSRTLSFSEAEEFEELRGDDRVVTTRGSGPSVEWDLEAGGLSFAALVVINGGEIVESGVSPAIKLTYRKKVTDARPFFRIEGQAISDSGGDVHCIIHKARSTGNVEGEFGDGEFFLTSGSGVGLPVSVSGVDEGVVYEFVQNETPVSISVT